MFCFEASFCLLNQRKFSRIRFGQHKHTYYLYERKNFKPICYGGLTKPSKMRKSANICIIRQISVKVVLKYLCVYLEKERWKIPTTNIDQKIEILWLQNIHRLNLFLVHTFILCKSEDLLQRVDTKNYVWNDVSLDFNVWNS